MVLHIVTDSTADLPLTLDPSLPISVVPLSVEWGGAVQDDDDRMDRGAFYAQLVQSDIMPRTSQPSPQRFQDVYRRVIEQGATQILSLHLSSSMSGTYRAAHIARESIQREYSEAVIEIVDSRVLTYSLGLGVLLAAQAAQSGHSLSLCRSLAQRAFSTASLLFTVDDFSYLQRGGRIGKASSMLGSLLRISPILSVVDGQVVGLERVRGRTHLVERMLHHFETAIPRNTEVAGVLLSGGNPAPEALSFFEAIRSRYDLGKVEPILVTPCVVAHVGPSSWGAVLMPTKWIHEERVYSQVPYRL
ncbi:DegV family protein [Pasteuria penetrans]|uniref:DegV family protein n=1 Tax=Pasteuria penetrans TaxID=86005 RepID=UPI000FBCB1A6|nr:DegV family protein [Pasteuria penetrans]